MDKVARGWTIVVGVVGLTTVGTVHAQPSAPVVSGLGTEPTIRTNIVRHHQVMMYGIPAAYRTLRDPLPYKPSQIKRGSAIFQQHCASCHGFSGHGDGPEGKQLVSPPANLSWLTNTPMNKSGPYMYWTIAEGGRPVGSDMPAYKDSLSSDEIWAVIGYVQNGPSDASHRH